jgi:hypothetical protein
VPTSGGSGEGEGEGSSIHASLQSTTSANSSTSLNSTPIISQPGTLDNGPDSLTGETSQDVLFVTDTSDTSDLTTPEGEGSSNDSQIVQAIDAVMSEDDEESLSNDELLDGLTSHEHDHDSTSLLDALDAVFEETV